MQQRIAVIALLIGGAALAACQRQTPMGAQAADQASPPPARIPVAATPAPAPPPSDADFVAKASASDAFEIAAGQAALAKASDERVKAFAAMMVKDHAASSQALAKAVAESGETLSLGGGLDPQQQSAMARLQAADPSVFDKVYMQTQVEAHQQATGLLQAYGQDGQNPALRGFVSRAAGVVQQHLGQAKRLGEQLP